MVVGVAANRMEWSGGEECSVLDSTRLDSTGLDWIGGMYNYCIALYCSTLAESRKSDNSSHTDGAGTITPKRTPENLFF